MAAGAQRPHRSQPAAGRWQAAGLSAGKGGASPTHAHDGQPAGDVTKSSAALQGAPTHSGCQQAPRPAACTCTHAASSSSAAPTISAAHAKQPVPPGSIYWPPLSPPATAPTAAGAATACRRAAACRRAPSRRVACGCRRAQRGLYRPAASGNKWAAAAGGGTAAGSGLGLAARLGGSMARSAIS